MRAGLCLIVLLIVALAPLQAAPETPSGEPVRLTLHPMPASVPALKHPLLPTLQEQKPGNAALLYYRSFSPEWWVYHRKEYQEKLETWSTMPLADLHKETLLLGLVRTNQLKEVDLAARRPYCDWEITDRARQDGIALLLPDIQSMRLNGTMLHLCARVAIAEGRFSDAVYTFQTGFALARHMGEAPILINDLVGLAIAQLMLSEVEEFIAQPKAPNLYWSLTGLPRPFISLRKSLEGEKFMFIESLFRPLAEKPMTPLTAEQLQELLESYLKSSNDGYGSKNRLLDQATVLGLCLKAYPEDKRFLVAHGFEAAAVERLPIVQVGLLASIHRYQDMMDDMVKWSNEPYHVSAPQLDKLEQQLREMKASSSEGIPMATLLVPAINKVNLAAARVDRRIAALRCIEAIRLHAAANGGTLPTKLEDIKPVPIPLDPLTGKPFDYQAEGTKATLKGVSPLGAGNTTYTINYEMTLTR